MGGCRCRQTPPDAASASRALHQADWGSASDQNLTAGQQSSSAADSSASHLLTAQLTDLSKWGISSLAADSPDSVHQASPCGFFFFCQRQVSACLPHARSVCTLHSARIIIFIFTSRNHPNHGNFNSIQTSPVRLAKLLVNTNRGNHPLELATRLLTSHQHRCLSACLSILSPPPLTSRWLIVDDGHKWYSQPRVCCLHKKTVERTWEENGEPDVHTQYACSSRFLSNLADVRYMFLFIALR